MSLGVSATDAKIWITIGERKLLNLAERLGTPKGFLGVPFCLFEGEAVEVLPGDTPETLQKRIMEQAEWILLPKAVEDFCAGRLQAQRS